MRRDLTGLAIILAAALASLAALPVALAQAPPPPTPTTPADQTVPPAQNPLSITVIAKQLEEGRLTIQPSLGASTYQFTPNVISSVPLGEQAPLNQVLLRAPGVAQDSFGQIHVRGDHANLQYRLDGVQLPEGTSLFTNALTTQYANKMALITGALPAQYGFRTAGIIDITLKSGRSDPGAEASMTAGSYNWLQPSGSYGGSSGSNDWFITGQFLHNDIGVENPASTAYPIHDSTDQWHALAKASHIIDENTRLSLIVAGAQARFQIPQIPGGGTPAFQVLGNTTTDAGALDQRQWENNYFAILSLQKHYGTLDFQVSAFTRYSGLFYQPDPMGDLMFNGISPSASRENLATGIQGDGSWKIAASHTCAAASWSQRERATTQTNGQVLPVDATGAQTTDVPQGILFGSDDVGWLYGVYLQDEWKATPTVTVNFGARFDAYSPTSENQVSPRINVVWQPNDWLIAHAGYARYFTPPPLAQVNSGGIAATLGTSAAPMVLTNDPVKAERAHYFDAGFQTKPLPGLTVGFDAYYKIAQNLLDEGQFGAPIFLTSFNYANANIKGWELTTSYDDGPWSIYGNLAWSQALATNIVSNQFNFAPTTSPSSPRTTSTSTTTRAGPPRPAPPIPSTRRPTTRRGSAPISSTAAGCARRCSPPTTPRCRPPASSTCRRRSASRSRARAVRPSGSTC